MTSLEPDLGTEPLDLSAHAKALLDAVVAISSDLDLHSVLLRIVESACEITGARYGALGVLGNAGGLVDFVTHGLSAEEREQIGALPRGHGILGLLIDHPEPIRMPRIQEHPRSYGFPAHHPPMESFLGVPVRIRGTVFGNLYLTEKAGGAEFTDRDEKLVEVLSTAAGFVIENARAYAQSERRRQWLEASAQVAEALQPPVRLEDALRQVTMGARRASGASGVALVQESDGDLRVAAAYGAASCDFPTLVESVRDVVVGGVEDDLVVMPRGPQSTLVLVPLRAHLAARGVLLVALEGGRGALEPEEAELLSSFAGQAALALDRAQAFSDRQELMLVADRDRIARDLHDLVIQRLFATGLMLQGVRRQAVGDDVRARIDNAVEDLDVTIRDIRSTIFELQHGPDRSLRAEVRAVVKEYVPVLGFTPLVRTTGPVDSVVPELIGDQCLAVLREALSNVARHAEADAAVVEVEADEQTLRLTVTDNGRGLPDERHESGLRNVRRRATDYGGEVRMLPEEPHGTRVEWTVPLPRA